MATPTSRSINWHTQFKQWLFSNRWPAMMIVATCVVGGAAAFVWISQTPSRVAERKLKQMETAESALIPGLMQDVLDLGDPGIETAVEALASDRPEVVYAARTALREELAQWRHLEPYEGMRRVRQLASALKDNVARFAPGEREFAAELATSILLWPMLGQSDERLAIVQDCESVLRESMKAPIDTEHYAARDAEYDALLAQLADDSQAIADRTPSVEVATLREPNDLIERLPTTNGVGPSPAPAPLDQTEMDLASFQGRSQEADRGIVQSAPIDPRDVIRGVDANNSPSRFQPPPLAVEQEIPAPLPLNSGSFDSSQEIVINDQMNQVETTPLRIPQPVIPQQESSMTGATEIPVHDPQTTVHLNYQWLSHIQLMQYLHSPDSAISKESEAELRRRGFTASQIELSKASTHPDPTVRIQAIDELITTARFDPKPWLRWLCEDDVVSVRQRAISYMATSADVEDLRFVDRILQADRNSEIRGSIKWR